MLALPGKVYSNGEGLSQQQIPGLLRRVPSRHYRLQPPLPRIIWACFDFLEFHHSFSSLAILLTKRILLFITPSTPFVVGAELKKHRTQEPHDPCV